MLKGSDLSRDRDGEFPIGLEEYAFYLIFQIQRRRDVMLDETLAPSGLNTARWRTLAVIERIENCSMSQLALYCAIDRTTLTRSVDQLVENGLVHRWTPPRDRRRVNLALTEAGQAVFAKALKLMLAQNADSIPATNDADLRTTIRTLQNILRGVSPDTRTAQQLLNFGPPSS
jgi:DNA-binding MarR family transcriptional regulator